MGKSNLSGHHTHEIYNDKVRLRERQRNKETQRHRDTDVPEHSNISSIWLIQLTTLHLQFWRDVGVGFNRWVADVRGIIIIIIIIIIIGDYWRYEYNRHRIPIWAGLQIDERYRRLTWNHVSFPAGLPGGPAIQFGGFQGYSSGPHRIGQVTLQLANLVFNSWFEPPGSILQEKNNNSSNNNNNNNNNNKKLSYRRETARQLCMST